MPIDADQSGFVSRSFAAAAITGAFGTLLASLELDARSQREAVIQRVGIGIATCFVAALTGMIIYYYVNFYSHPFTR